MEKSKITQLTFQKNVNRVSVFIDGVFAFGLSTEIALKANLHTNQELTLPQIEKLLTDSLAYELYQKSLERIAARPRSIQEVRQYLRQRLYILKDKYLGSSYLVQLSKVFENTDTLIKQIIEKLEKNQFLNDEQFACWWIEQRVAFKPRGKYALSAELRKKGIDKKVLEQVFETSSVLTPKKNQELIEKVLQKAWRSIKHRGYDKNKAKEVLYRRLLSKGFTWDEIKPQIDEFISKQYN